MYPLGKFKIEVAEIFSQTRISHPLLHKEKRWPQGINIRKVLS